MTDHHDDQPWGLEDDELVRSALVSLREDVSAQPLPEPAFVRARAEGREQASAGQVVDLARRRRRSFTLLAGVAAAALIATGTGFLVQARVDTAPPAATSTDSAGEPTMRMLDSSEWSAALGLPVASTQGTTDPDGQCFQAPRSDTWDRRVSTLDDGRVVAGQWIGTASGGTDAPTDAIDTAVAQCEETYTVTQRVTEDLPGDARFRSWHARGADGATYWWVEATRGASTSYLTVAELDGMTYTSEEMRQVAQSALGDFDLTASRNAP
ncbi:hypothetical protein [Janibacter limosus]|jgi:hypothetical protein|uniref:hypothetical protein n=1 Tax=Janibacter limosus TaxID=53458 RepID=UPI00082B7E3F|nr:hypothetical protein [Janibacter limosus]